MSSRLQGLSSIAVQRIVVAARALEAGHSDLAADALADVLARYPEHPEARRLEAGALSLRGQHDLAISTMRHALALRSGDGLYHNTMATVLANAGEFDEAIGALQRACELLPSMAEAWYNLGILLVRCVRYSEASQALLRAVSISPKHTLARSQLADLLRVSNRPEEAIAQYRELLAEQPWSGMAWWGLADVKTLSLGEQDSAAIRAALRSPAASENDRIAMGFALAKALGDQGLYGESLNELEQANVIARRQRIWEAATFTATVDSIQIAFTPPPPGLRAKRLGQ